VSAILIYDTLQQTFPLPDAVINEAHWQSALLPGLEYDHLINCIKLPAADRGIASLLYGSKWRNLLKSGSLGAHGRLNAGDILACR